MDPGLPIVRDAVAALVIASASALVVWLLPFAGVPVVGLLAGPLGLLLLVAWGCTPMLLADLEQPLLRTVGGVTLLLVGGQLTAVVTFWSAAAAQGAALGWSRGAGAGALVPLIAPLACLTVPFGVLVAGVLLARRIRVGAAVLVAALVAGLAPATANTVFFYAWLGVPLSA